MKQVHLFTTGWGEGRGVGDDPHKEQEHTDKRPELRAQEQEHLSRLPECSLARGGR